MEHDADQRGGEKEGSEQEALWAREGRETGSTGVRGSNKLLSSAAAPTTTTPVTMTALRGVKSRNQRSLENMILGFRSNDPFPIINNT